MDLQQTQNDSLFSIHRPSLTPSVDIPFGIRSCGHYKVNHNFKDLVLRKDFVEIFWCIKGRGGIVIDGSEQILEKNQLAVYFPNTEHQIYSIGEAWEYRWVTFDGSLAESTIRSFGFTREGIYPINKLENTLFKQLIKDLEDVSPSGERKACCTGFTLLACSAQQLHQQQHSTYSNKSIKAALNFIHQHWNDPMIGVEQVAKHFKLNRSSFSKLFLSEVNITPKDYITRLRVQFALNKLKQSQDSIKQIAQDSGWEDPNYFSRCIKAATGLSPSQYRKQNAVNTN